jgi:hypothetical protein
METEPSETREPSEPRDRGEPSEPSEPRDRGEPSEPSERGAAPSATGERGGHARARWYERWLSSRAVPLVVALVALALALPSLAAGFLLDDHTHAASLDPAFRAQLPMRGDWDLFRFQDADRAYFELNRERGIWPWWTSGAFRLAFFRPLASLWHALDHRLFGERLAWVMHLESALVYAGVAAVVALLYRRLVAPLWVAGLAALFYAVDHTHSFPVTWIANRNALLAALFGFSALHFHLRGRVTGRRRDGALAALSFSLALASGEAAVGAFGYVLAYALAQAPEVRRRELTALWPFVAAMAIYAALYVSLGYGARGGAMYVDPMREPLELGRAVVVRGPLLLMAQVLVPPADALGGLPPSSLPVVAAVFALVLYALFRLSWPVVRGSPAARFFLLGALLSTLPVTATQPSDRLLVFPGFGVLGLAALAVAHASERRAPVVTALRKVLAGALVVVHVGLSPLLFVAKTHLVGQMFGGLVKRGEASFPTWREGDDLVVLNAPDTLLTGYVLAIRMLRHEPLPRSLQLLSVMVRGAGTVTRAGERTLVLTLDEGFIHDTFSRIFRNEREPLRPGATVKTSAVEVTVLESGPGGRPGKVRFRFERALDDPTLRLVTWVDRGFVPFEPPRLGETVPLPLVDYGKALAP